MDSKAWEFETQVVEEKGSMGQWWVKGDVCVCLKLWIQTKEEFFKWGTFDQTLLAWKSNACSSQDM